MRVRDSIAHHLRERGLSKCFGLIGEDVAELLVSLTESGADYFSARHESSAIAMADGYSRASGSVGVAVISQGPGLLNGMNALTTAAKANSSLLVFVGQGEVSTDVANKGRKGKFIDQELVLRGAGITSAALTSPTSAVADVVRAFEVVASGETVVLTVRPSVLNADAGDESATIALAQRPGAASPDPAVISDVADLIQTTWAASKPIILAGRGAVRAEAKPELEQLAERCGALLTSTLLANGMFRGNPYDLGITGTFSTPVASEMLGRADIILAFGASLNGRTTDGGELFPDAMVVQFDSDPHAVNRYPFVKPELFVQGDVRLSAMALLDELRRREHQYEGFRTPTVAQAIASHGGDKEYSDQSNEEGLDPRTVIRAIEAMLPEDRIVVTDGGHHFNWEAAYLKAYDPASWISPLDFSSIGSGTGVAVGAAIAHPDRLTVMCVGDGGLMMTIGEVSTAARYNLPVLFLVNNDAAYGSDLHILEMDGVPADIALSDDVDFAAIGRAMGAKGVTVRRLADLDALKGLIDAFDGPLVVDYKVNRDVLSHSLGRFLKVSRTLTDSPDSSPGQSQLQAVHRSNTSLAGRMKNEIGRELIREKARLDQADFRRVLGHFSTGVTVVTAVSEGEPVGFTCQSFISLSLDPPLIAFAPAKTSTSWPRIAKAPAFCVNILSSEQAALGRAFAISGRKKFEGVRWRPGLTGAPVIDDTLAYVECRHWAVYEAGDHDLVMAQVVAVKHSSGEPLLYFRSEFRSLA